MLSLKIKTKMPPVSYGSRSDFCCGELLQGHLVIQGLFVFLLIHKSSGIYCLQYKLFSASCTEKSQPLPTPSRVNILVGERGETNGGEKSLAIAEAL